MYLLSRLTTVVLAGLVLVSGLGARNLIANADFSEPLESGWITSSTDDEPDVEVRAGQPNVIRVGQHGSGLTRVLQRIPVKDLNLRLRFAARFQVRVNRPGYGALAGLSVTCYDRDTNELGRTLIGCEIKARPEALDPNRHFVPVTDSDWHDFQLDLSDELAEHGAGSEAQDVALVEIALVADNGLEEGC